jgi:hypothetical protein
VADQLVTWWQQLAPGYDATQHFLGPMVVTIDDGGATATCSANVRAFHHVVADEGLAATWMVAGRYTIGLERSGDGGGDGDRDGWRIASITLTVAYEEGDRHLVDVARHRAETSTGGRTATRPEARLTRES